MTYVFILHILSYFFFLLVSIYIDLFLFKNNCLVFVCMYMHLHIFYTHHNLSFSHWWTVELFGTSSRAFIGDLCDVILHICCCRIRSNWNYLCGGMPIGFAHFSSKKSIDLHCCSHRVKVPIPVSHSSGLFFFFFPSWVSHCVLSLSNSWADRTLPSQPPE